MSKKILIIEDEQTLVKALTASLTEADGYKITFAIDGEEGLVKVKEFKPDLILLDLILPKMDGFEVLRRLKADETTKNIPVFILSNLSDVADKVMKLGAADYLVKADYSLTDIEGRVRKQLE